jgi:hypothetical protein
MRFTGVPNGVSAKKRRAWCIGAGAMRAFFLWAVVLGPAAVAACGSSGGDRSPSGQGCTAGQVYCSGCGSGGFCASSGVAVRPQFPCSVDPDCQLIDGAAPSKPMVCGQPGGCVSGESCIPACQSDSDCTGGNIVCSSGHCVAKPCQVDSDCPSIGIDDFACSGPNGARVCTLKGCASDSDCHGGFCVDTTYSSQRGFCGPSAI